MFLNELNKEQGKAFIDLVNQFAYVDEVLAKEEKRLISEYLKELELDESDIGQFEYDDLINVLRNSTTRIKSIIYFELVGLALVDGNYGDKEIDFLDKIAYDLDIPRYKKIAFANYFVNFKEIYEFSVVEYNNKNEKLKEQAEALLN